MKKILFSLLLIVCLFTFGCEKNNNDDLNKDTNTVASILVKDFESIAKDSNDVISIANKLSTNEVFDINVVIEELNTESYIAGFDKEIKDFKSGVALKPMIGTIPFVAYVFESNDTEAFVKELKDNANLRWNICTEADEMKVSIIGNYVFFVMSPKNFE